MNYSDLSPLVALGAGIASFFSPCVLPLLPIYVSYLTGTSVSDLNANNLKRIKLKLIKNGIFFIFGFSLVFVLFGLSASSMGKILLRNQIFLRRIGGIIIMVLGFHLSGIWRFSFLSIERRINYQPASTGYFNPLLMGIAFSLGWTPCTGSILGGILVLAGNTGSLVKGTYLLALYSLGMAIPFLISSLFLSSILKIFRYLGSSLAVIQTIVGIMMIGLGIAMFTGWLVRLSGYFSVLV